MHLQLTGVQNGSIPARTGEPGSLAGRTADLPVYPRAYGGTRKPNIKLSHASGLSPRVRGNRRFDIHCGLLTGSIPARTGEPYQYAYSDQSDKVYPRAYGGTAVRLIGPAGKEGLSPRVRGNPFYKAVHLRP